MEKHQQLEVSRIFKSQAENDISASRLLYFGGFVLLFISLSLALILFFCRSLSLFLGNGFGDKRKVIFFKCIAFC